MANSCETCRHFADYVSRFIAGTDQTEAICLNTKSPRHQKWVAASSLCKLHAAIGAAAAQLKECAP